MKKQLLLLFVVLVTLLLSIQSCKSTKATTKTNVNAEETVVIESGPNSYLNRFVSVDAILDLKPGMSYDEVYAKLGSKPHNLFSGQLDGHHIFQYKYRLTKIEVPSANTNNYGLEKKNNKVVYQAGDENLYIVFNAVGKLEYMVTSQGSESERILRENNLLYVIKKDKDKFASDTSRAYRATNSDPFNPLIPCSNCDKSIKISLDKDGTHNSATPSTTDSNVAAPAVPQTPASKTPVKKGIFKL